MSIYNIDLSTYEQTFKVDTDDKLEYGEIYTPFKLIDKMLDLFDPAIFSDPTKRWLDAGAGKGYFSMRLFGRLNIGLSLVMPNEDERKTHIIKHMLYMVELKDSNIIALKELFGEENPNIIHFDYCMLNSSQILVIDAFDVIIGNPPYNSKGIKKVPTNKTIFKKNDGITLWHNFLTTSLSLLKPITGKLCMIIPSIWLKPDKAGMHKLLTSYKLEKIHCYTSNETNTIFKGEAQTPTCFFLLTHQKRDAIMGGGGSIITLFDKTTSSYVNYYHMLGTPIPTFGQTITKKLQKWVETVGYIKVLKTNMPSSKSKFVETPYDVNYPFINIKTCVLNKTSRRPQLMINYSNIKQAFHGEKKIVMAHKMYGFPYYDKEGHFGISNRDSYVITGKTNEEFEQLQAFLTSKFALFMFETTRYRMKYLEKYAFQLIPDITRIVDFPKANNINDTTIAEFYELDKRDCETIQKLHKKDYVVFIP